MNEVTAAILLAALASAIACYRVTGSLPFFPRRDLDEPSSEQKTED